MNKPKYQHDCDRCVWLGTWEHNFDPNVAPNGKHLSDFYFCLGAIHDGYGVTKKLEHPTIVVRYSDRNPEEYLSTDMARIILSYLNDTRFKEFT